MSLFRGKLGYIANRKRIDDLSTIYDNYDSEIAIFDKPFCFQELYMPLADSYSLKKYGEDVSRMLRMYVNINQWYGKIHVGDRAYLIDESTSQCDINSLAYEDDEYCSKANYQVVSVEVQNIKLKVEFEKIN